MVKRLKHSLLIILCRTSENVPAECSKSQLLQNILLSFLSLVYGDIEEFKIQKMMKRNCRDPGIVFLLPILLSSPQASKIFFNLLSSADLS